MNRFRFFGHPLLSDPKSRKYFYFFWVVSICMAGIYWWEVRRLGSAGFDSLSDPNAVQNLIEKILFSPILWLLVATAAAYFAAALTAHLVVGSNERIMAWLQEWDENHMPSDLVVRRGDKNEHIARLLTEIRKENP